MYRIAIMALMLLSSINFSPSRSHASDDSESYDYLLVLPLQYNYYQPPDPQGLALGNGLDNISGAAAAFGNPAKLAVPDRYQVMISAGYLSDGRSSPAIVTEGSSALPSTAAGMFKWKANNFALGYRQAMKVGIIFPDMRDPEIIDRADLCLNQLALAWSFSGIKNLSLGVCLTWTQFDFKWYGPTTELAAGRGSAPGFSAGLLADLGPGVYFSAGFKSKTELSCITQFYGDSTGSELKMAGAIPQIGWMSFKYQPEPGLEIFAGMEMTGWHLISSGYLEQMDYHLGCSLELINNRLEAYLGSYSLKHPLDSYLRRYDPYLQNMYFITAGLGCRLGPVKLICSAATSHPFSGKGLNQNLLSAGIVYQDHP